MNMDNFIHTLVGGLAGALFVASVTPLITKHETAQVEVVSIDCGETNLSSLWREAERYGEVSLSTWDMRPIGDLGYSVRVSLDEDPIKVDASFKGKTPEEALTNAVEVLSARFKIVDGQPKEQPNE